MLPLPALRIQRFRRPFPKHTRRVTLHKVQYRNQSPHHRRRHDSQVKRPLPPRIIRPYDPKQQEDHGYFGCNLSHDAEGVLDAVRFERMHDLGAVEEVEMAESAVRSDEGFYDGCAEE